jgi:putative phosphoesterase
MSALGSVVALYDVHGNLPALEAVLAELDEADLIVAGGDVVGGEAPAETVERLRALGTRVRWLRGNAERELVEQPPPREAGPPPGELERLRAALTDEQAEFLYGLPERVELEVAGLGHVLFCHAVPQNDLDIVTPLTSEERLARILEGVDADVVVAGHTHIQEDRRVGGIRWINAGSVGMPYEEQPGAYWALLGPDVELRRTPIGDASEAIGATGYPEEWPRARPEEATELFERLARERA